ncbi:MAG: ABC transporter ATP-binding protein [Peptococcaceae bacterium]|nr:ABC transporter ATP-binding protein [Peptococcaceae bacterium]
MTNILEIKDLQVEFPIGDTYCRAVRRISFAMAEGRRLGLVGESGCGKSVTSLAVMRLHPASARISGIISLRGQNLLDLPETEMQKIRGNQIGMIFQEPMTSLNPVRKIGDQIGESLVLHKGLTGAQAHREAVVLLGHVGIPRAGQVAGEYPHQLSGGMRQRVMIAIAMACNPAILIADEPTTALDVTIQAQILDMMRKVAEESGASILMITHNLGVIAEICDQVAVMYAGNIVEQGEVGQIFHHPAHPYTRGLLNSLPRITGKRTRLQPIEGNVPSIRNIPDGCAFAPRCREARNGCRIDTPGLYEVASGHWSRCFLYAS